MQHAQGGVGAHIGLLLGGTPSRGTLLSGFFGSLCLTRLAPSCQPIVTGCVFVEFREGFVLFAFATLLLVCLFGFFGTTLLFARRFFCRSFDLFLFSVRKVLGLFCGCQLGNFPLEVSAPLFALADLLPELLVGDLEFFDLVFQTRLGLVAFKNLTPELSDRYLGVGHKFRRIRSTLRCATSAD